MVSAFPLLFSPLRLGSLTLRNRVVVSPHTTVFATADGHIVLMPMADHMWQRLCDALGLDELGADPELADAHGRLAQRSRVCDAVAAALSGRRTAEAEAVLREAGVPAAAVQTVAQALADPQVEARGMIVEAGGVRMVGNPIRISGNRALEPRPAPAAGEHTAEVLPEVAVVD